MKSLVQDLFFFFYFWNIFLISGSQNMRHSSLYCMCCMLNNDDSSNKIIQMGDWHCNYIVIDKQKNYLLTAIKGRDYHVHRCHHHKAKFFKKNCNCHHGSRNVAFAGDVIACSICCMQEAGCNE